MMNQQPPFPMQPMAEQMAQQGRFGDSMLVHMNPIEVAGIASLSPTGQLTTNPMTGQPEAFLPFLAPLLGSVFGSTITGALASGASALGLGSLGTATAAGTGLAGALAGASAPVASAIGSGLATTAVTGDLKEGLVSGLTGFGIGKAFEAGAKALAGTEQLAKEAATAAKTAESAKAAALAADPTLTTEALSKLPSVAEAGVADQALKDSLMAAKEMAPTEVISRGGLGNVGKNLLTPGAAIPIAIGEGERAAMARREEMDRMFDADRARSEEELRRAEEALDSARYLNVTGEGYGAYDYLGDDPYFPTGLSQGGITSINPEDFMRRQTELHGLAGEMPPVKRMREGGPSFNPSPSYGLGGSTRAQAALRGSVVIKPEELEGYRPGFDPEIKYFREPTQEEIDAAKPPAGTPTPTPTPNPGPGLAVMSAKADPDRDFSKEQSLYQKAKSTVESGGGSVRKRKAAKARVERFEKEFGVPGAQESVEEFYYRDATPPPASSEAATPTAFAPAVSTSAATSPTPSGIESILQANLESGNIPPETRALIMESALGRGGMGRGIGMQGGGETNKALEDAQKLLEQTRMALLGRLDEEESEIIINRFIDEFGLETFQQLRSVVLEDVVPDSQKEGLIEGVGSGMDDLVPGMIGDQQPVAVSPGEFIVPADVVSGLGDGDTNAGAKDLEGMMDRVRMERTGTTQQPAPLMAKRGGILPA